MSIYELDISWAMTARERRRLHWELITSDEVSGVFLTARDDVLAVLYTGDRGGFDALARSLAPDRWRRPGDHHTNATTNEQGALS